MRPPLLPYDTTDDALARATWSRLAEPGDKAAAALVVALGPADAIDWLLGEALDEDGRPRQAPRPPLPPVQDAAGARAQWARAAGRWAPRLPDLDIRRELDILERLGGSLITPADPWWPPGLDDLAQPPPCLWLRGDPALLVSAAQRASRDHEANPPAAAAQPAIGVGTAAQPGAPKVQARAPQAEEEPGCRGAASSGSALGAEDEPTDSVPVMSSAAPGDGSATAAAAPAAAERPALVPLPTREDRVPPGPGAGIAVALVGARAATRYGERTASQLGEDLAAQGCVVVSGGALGIDAAAHRGALMGGRTLCVAAGGVDRLYPSANAELQEAVIAHGALLAEVPPGCQPGRHRFLTRNRLIAALCQATVVVEAAWRSGALATARQAQDLGRPLGAVPGPVTSMESVGCHRLLRAGAVCVTDAEEVLELALPVGATDPDGRKAADPANQGEGLLDGLEPDSAVVLDALPARGSASMDSLIPASGLAEREVIAALGLLELAGRVERDGSRWRRRRT